MSELSGKRVVITGGGSGIGEGIAKALAAEGCKVVIGGRTVEKLKVVAEGISGEHTVGYHPLDVADRTSVETFFIWAKEILGGVDILINSAGINIAKRSMAEMVPEDWDKVLTTNATGAYNCIAAVLPGMREQKDGLIISVASIAGLRAIAGLAGVAYCASKFAVSALGTAVAEEEKKHGIRVTTIYPGEVATAILDRRPVPPSAEARAAMVQPEDVAAAVIMIAKLPPRANVLEMVIKPTVQTFI
ncbi:SDR family oxidoreductase [Lacunimicrobium album]